MKIFIASVDFDGCLGGAKFIAAYQQIKHLRLTDPELYKEKYKRILKETHPQLIQDIITRSADCEEIQIKIGSNRQTLERDKDNGYVNGNDSCFDGINFLAEVISDELNHAKPVVADLSILDDTLLQKEPGYHAQSRNQNDGSIERTPLAEARNEHLSLLRDHKYVLMFMQMTMACSQKPDCEFVYHFYDDVPAIIEESVAKFNGANRSNVPSNLLSIGITNYQDMSALEYLELASENIHRAEKPEEAASLFDVELFELVANNVSKFANARKQQFSDTVFNEGLDDARKKIAAFTAEIAILKVEQNSRSEFVDQDLVKGVEIQMEIKGLYELCQQLQYVPGHENTKLIENIHEAFKANNLEKLLKIFIDPNLVTHLQGSDFLRKQAEFKSKVQGIKKQDAEIARIALAIKALEDKKDVCENIVKFINSIRDVDTRLLEETTREITKSLNEKQPVTISALKSAIDVLRPFGKLLVLKSHSNLRVINNLSGAVEETGYKPFLDEYKAHVATAMQPLLRNSDMMIINDCQIEVAQAQSVPSIKILSTQARDMMLACMDASIWGKSPSISKLSDAVTKASLDKWIDNTVSTKAAFASKLNDILANPDFNRSAILALFNELKNPNGRFAFIHTSENKRWDAFRLLFKSNRHAKQDEKKFWYTKTYQDAVKKLKEAYLARANDTTASLDDGSVLLDYYRGNKVMQLKQTASRKAITKSV